MLRPTPTHAVPGQKIRELLLHLSRQANVGHIGSGLSVADIVGALYSDVLHLSGPPSKRDRFVLSKGHAALCLYVALHLRGLMDASVLNTFMRDGSLLGVHPEHEVPGIDFSTGSLGQGLGMGCGAALAARMQGCTRRCFVLASDAECEEGSMWEAALFAFHHRLSNLVLVIDDNGQQAFGYTDEVLSLGLIEEKWRGFGWNVCVVDGHDQTALSKVLCGLDTTTPGAPHAIVAKTVFGKGVSYMQRQIKWHYWPMNEEEYALAMREIGGLKCA